MPQEPEISIEDMIRREATAAGIPVPLALGLAEHESSFNPGAMGPPIDQTGTRAVGIYQFLPQTAAQYQIDPRDPEQNIRGGMRYLNDLLTRHQGDRDKALREFGGVVRDQQYLPAVTARIAKYEALEPASLGAGTPPPAPPGPWENFTHEATAGLRALPELARAVPGLARGANAAVQQAFWHPVDTAKAANAAIQQGFWHPVETYNKLFGTMTDKVREAYEAGDYARAALEAKNIPLSAVGVGGRLGEAEDFMRKGEVAKGLGATTDIGLGVAIPEGLAKFGLPLLPRVIKPRLTGEQAAAVKLLQKHGVPVDVATATQSRFARNIQGAAEATPLGGAVHEGVRWERQRTLPKLADELANQVHPSTVTPGEAGLGLRSATGDAASALKQQSSAAYDIVDQIASDPVHRQVVQTGTSAAPFWPPGGARVPIMEAVQAPVDLRAVKASLRQVREEIAKQMPLGQQQYSKGLLAIDNVLALRDFEPVGITERNLGALKRAARGADHPAFKSMEQGTAGLAVRDVSQAVDDTMARLGPQAQSALAEARAATKAKWAVEDLFDDMNVEKVQAFETATGAGDRHVEGLAELARVAPQEMPKVGRAVLEKIFTHAEGLEQGWGRAAGVARMWENLGPETKQILFGSRTTDLNRFFLGQKMLAELANPSRTMLVGTSVGSALGVMANPFWGMTAVVGSGAVAALMNTRAGVRLLTQGLRIPPGDTTRAAAWAVSVANQLKREGQQRDAGTPPPAPPGATPPTGPPPAPPGAR